MSDEVTEIMRGAANRLRDLIEKVEKNTVPKGPKGQKRPADVIGNAVKVMRIATGEEDEDLPNDGKDPAAQSLGSRGGKARAAALATSDAKRLQKPPPQKDGKTSKNKSLHGISLNQPIRLNFSTATAKLPRLNRKESVMSELTPFEPRAAQTATG